MSNAPRTEHRRFHAATAQADYARSGYAEVPGFLRDIEAAIGAVTAVTAAHEGLMTRLDIDGRPARNMDEGGPYHHWVAPTVDAYAILPGLPGLYHAARIITEVVTCRPVMLSPYFESAVTLKVYAPGDEQGWHRDTNPVTALLVLNGDRPVFEWRDGTPPPAGQPVDPGTLLVFSGRQHRHVVPPVHGDYPKVVVAFNLYHPEDLWRPADMDGVVYGGE